MPYSCYKPSSFDKCTVLRSLTEGDSAKALAISGLGVVGRDYYGVFPLKGKLLNVREASHKQKCNNEEIQNIAKILGLVFGKVYDNTTSLRYGHLMIMTDQDQDGSHIKGLLINFLHHFWPSLLTVPGFLQQFITPIVKVLFIIPFMSYDIVFIYSIYILYICMNVYIISAPRARMRRSSSRSPSTATGRRPPARAGDGRSSTTKVQYIPCYPCCHPPLL